MYVTQCSAGALRRGGAPRWRLGDMGYTLNQPRNAGGELAVEADEVSVFNVRGLPGIRLKYQEVYEDE